MAKAEKYPSIEPFQKPSIIFFVLLKNKLTKIYNSNCYENIYDCVRNYTEYFMEDC